MRRARPLVTVAAAVALTIAAGCGSDDGPSSPGDSTGISVVTSTNVYASIAQRIGGDRVKVEAILDDPSADPHSFEATPKDQVRIAKAQLVIANGGGYDDFATAMVEAADPQPVLINAVEVSGLADSGGSDGGHDDEHGDGHDDDHADEHDDGDATEQDAESSDDHTTEQDGESAAEHASEHATEQDGEADADHDAEHATEQDGKADADHDAEHADGEGHGEGHEHGHEGHDHGAFNEHVFYDLGAMTALGNEIAHQLGVLDPDGTDEFTANAKSFAEELAGLADRAEQLRAAHSDLQAIVTEPVAGYLLEAAGISDVTPEGFSSAIESENDPAPKDVAAVDQLLTGGTVALLVNNEQTSGPVTEQVTGIAEQAAVPVVGVTETLPDGTTDYVAWMSGTLDQLEDALAG